MTALQINPEHLAFHQFVYGVNGVGGLGGMTVAQAREAWALSQDGTLTIRVNEPPWTVAPEDDSYDDWYMCAVDQMEIDWCAAFPAEGYDVTFWAVPTRNQCPNPGGGPEVEFVACPGGPLLSLHWDYEQGTLYDTTGTHEWGGAWADQSDTFCKFATSDYARTGTQYSHLAGTTHLAISEGQQLTLTLDANNRLSSGPPENASTVYIVSWYVSLTAVNAFGSDTILVTPIIGNAWSTGLSGSLIAPAGANAFSIRMPRQAGQDNVTVTVTE